MVMGPGHGTEQFFDGMWDRTIRVFLRWKWYTIFSADLTVALADHSAAKINSEVEGQS